MELFGKTELEQYYPEAVVATSGHFVVIRYGWFSYSFLRDPGEGVAEAAQFMDAIRLMDE